MLTVELKPSSLHSWHSTAALSLQSQLKITIPFCLLVDYGQDFILFPESDKKCYDQIFFNLRNKKTKHPCLWSQHSEDTGSWVGGQHRVHNRSISNIFNVCVNVVCACVYLRAQVCVHACVCEGHRRTSGVFSIVLHFGPLIEQLPIERVCGFSLLGIFRSVYLPALLDTRMATPSFLHGTQTQSLCLSSKCSFLLNCLLSKPPNNVKMLKFLLFLILYLCGCVPVWVRAPSEYREEGVGSLAVVRPLV